MIRPSYLKSLVMMGILLGTAALILYSCAQLKQKPPSPAATPETQALSPPLPGIEAGEDLTTLPEPGLPFAKQNRNPELILKDLPRDAAGNIDWVKALKDGIIHPKGTLEPGKPEIPPFPLDVEIPAVGAMPNVIFPHFPHTMWLECGNCHPNIFTMRKGSNPMSMVKIVNGEFCGRCHGRVAFPLSNCNRCHVKPKG
ncbi:MAG TPA: c(7)-type cytochrome triheme domain-containing protein [Nitrospiria bacterium]|nr:c(7)-type cytochrome triheme domain-containing protein [Nitrospiria bacterium]